MLVDGMRRNEHLQAPDLQDGILGWWSLMTPERRGQRRRKKGLRYVWWRLRPRCFFLLKAGPHQDEACCRPSCGDRDADRVPAPLG